MAKRKPVPPIMSVDPTRMNGIHREFRNEFRKRTAQILADLQEYLNTPSTKARWMWLTIPQKQQDIQARLASITVRYTTSQLWIEKLIARAYVSGVERSFDEVRARTPDSSEKVGEKREFLRQIVSPPVVSTPISYASIWDRPRASSTVIKVFNEAKDVNKVPRALPPRDVWGQFMTAKAHELSERLAQGWKRQADALSQTIAKEVMNGINQGLTPDEIAVKLQSVVTGIPADRAMAIAQTEVTRAHAEGQLDGMGKLGVTQVEGIPEVEISTAGDFRVCSRCASLTGIPFTIEEARGKIPLHVRCRCAWKAYVPNFLVKSE